MHTGTSISDGTTLMAWIDWDAAITALHAGQIPACGGLSELAIRVADLRRCGFCCVLVMSGG